MARNKSKSRFQHGPKPFKLTIKFRKTGRTNGAPSLFGPEQLALFMSSLQTLYNHACEAFDIMPHQLKITRFEYPDGVWQFDGLGDPALVVKALLLAAPDVIANVADPLPAALNNRHDGQTAAGEQQHLDLIRPVIQDLLNIRKKHWQTHIQYTLRRAIGGPTRPGKLIKVGKVDK